MINKLVAKIKKTEAPIVVGLDPTLKFIPEHILKKAYAEYGETLKAVGKCRKGRSIGSSFVCKFFFVYLRLRYAVTACAAFDC